MSAPKKYQRPQAVFLGYGPSTKVLSRLGEHRDNALQAAARELGKVLSHGETKYWTHTMPEALFNVLDSFELPAAILAAAEFLRRNGYGVRATEDAYVVQEEVL